MNFIYCSRFNICTCMLFWNCVCLFFLSIWTNNFLAGGQATSLHTTHTDMSRISCTTQQSQGLMTHMNNATSTVDPPSYATMHITQNAALAWYALWYNNPPHEGAYKTSWVSLQIGSHLSALYYPFKTKIIFILNCALVLMQILCIKLHKSDTRNLHNSVCNCNVLDQKCLFPCICRYLKFLYYI
jgi:hypothetical protein